MTNETEKKLSLKKPIVMGDLTITELTLREPTAGELDYAEQNSKGSNGATIIMIATVSGKHPDVIKQMGARDYTEAAKYIKTFLSSDPEIGKI
jgi:hypothetical protein